MSHFDELLRQKEIINLRESAQYSWREDLAEGKKEEESDHPYVEVMPKEKDPNEVIADKAKKKKEDKEKEEVKEGVEKEHSKKEHGNWNAAGVYVGPDRKKLKLSPDKKLRKEELSIEDQMRISRDHNRKSKEEKLKANKAALGAVKKVAQKKDERTDAQKMTDAANSNPGSFYRNAKR